MAAKEESIWCSRQWEILYGRFAALRRGDHFIDADVAIKDRKSTRLNSSNRQISYAVFCLKKNNRAKKSGMVNITSRVNSREMSGINTILHELNPLFTINVTMRDIKSKNVYSRVNSKATTKWRKT